MLGTNYKLTAIFNLTVKVNPRKAVKNLFSTAFLRKRQTTHDKESVLTRQKKKFTINEKKINIYDQEGLKAICHKSKNHFIISL